MATSGTSSFNLGFTELAEEAWERCGAEVRSGYDLKTTRRSMNILLADWANRGLNMWTIEEGTIPLVAGTATYDLPIDTVDLIEHISRTGSGTNQQDISISRISVSTYSSIPNKTATGRPLQIYINRRSGATNPPPGSEVQYPTATLWPAPDDSQPYTLVYWRLRRIQDVGNGVGTADIPFRFIPALVAGLAYYVGMKIPQAADRLPVLKAEYEEAFMLAAMEDRDRSSVRFVPRTAY